MRKLVFIIIGVAGVLLVFQAGLAVGERKAAFNHHGLAGRVISLSPPNFLVSGPDGVERLVLTTTSTEFSRFHERVSFGDLHQGDAVVILGMPTTNGEVGARFVRIMPMLPPHAAQ